MKFKITLFFLIFIFLSLNTYAINNKYGLWSAIQFFGKFKNSPSYLYNLKLEARFKTTNHFYDEGFIRAALGYALDDATTLFLGVDFFPALGLSNRDHEEYRLWQQFKKNKAFEKFEFSSRTRIEQRKKSSNSQVAVRLRQQFTLQKQQPLFKNFFPLLWDEVFINFNHVAWVNTHTINQNRLFLGFNTLYHSFTGQARIRVKMGQLNFK